ncbi:STAS domain-containing protein [Halobacillus mangrovi]|uniref:STAS domain-containing protein n=1 Tax=Halobacillus mangrovi TaxID=402384 RepID=UPI003D96921F
MSIPYTYIGEKITENKEEVALILTQLEKEEKAGELSTRLNEKRLEMLKFIAEGLLNKGMYSVERVEQWISETGEIGWEEGVPLQYLQTSMNLLKNAIWYIFEEDRLNQSFSSATILYVIKTISPLFDTVTSKLSDVYINHHQEEWEKAQEVVEELSVPVVPITKGIAVLPLIGEIDSNRAQLVMETSLQQSTELDLSHLFIDVSGVPVIDTVVAHNIYQVVHALELVGVKTTMTGIRPEIARSVVGMGMKFTEIPTKASLHQALDDIGLIKELNKE